MTRSDNGNGTFTNPVIFADYPDPDIIRVEDDFYLASSSFTDVPGIPICHSRDLVNWRLIGHVYNRLPDTNPAYSMSNGQVAYRGGAWAPSLRHHDGKFYVAVNMPVEGFFLFVADRADGPYQAHWFEGMELYDPALFFDDDGRAYVFHGAGDIFVSELASDLGSLAGRAHFLHSSAFGQPLEGTHAYKRNGWYYLCHASRGYNGLEVVYRSRSLLGPYESRVVCADDMNYSGAGLHQGGFVELRGGETWFFMFQDRDYVGRVPVLQPVTWRDDWPIVGDSGNFGRAVVTGRKPSVVPQGETFKMERGDHFDHPELGLQWHWNHNPDDSRWSLSARAGWLRLNSGYASNLLHARNTLTQKIVGGGCAATVTLDSTALYSGDRAGLCVLGFPFAYLAVEDNGGRRRVLMVNDGNEIAASETMAVETIQLRAEADAQGVARFSYSQDRGTTFARLGDELVMQFSVKSFLGNKFGLFCFNSDDQPAALGYADFDNFIYEAVRARGNCHEAHSLIPAASYDFTRGVHVHRRVEKQPHQFLVNIHDGDWVRFDRVDFGKGANRFEVCASGTGCGGVIELRLDGIEGELIGKCAVKGSGSQNQWLSKWEELSGELLCCVSGVRTLCLCFAGNDGYLMRLDWLRFSASTP